MASCTVVSVDAGEIEFTIDGPTVDLDLDVGAISFSTDQPTVSVELSAGSVVITLEEC